MNETEDDVRRKQIGLHSPFADVGDAAAYLRCSVSQIYNWMARGLIKPHYPSTRPLFRKSDLEAFVLKSSRNPRVRRGRKPNHEYTEPKVLPPNTNKTEPPIVYGTAS